MQRLYKGIVKKGGTARVQLPSLCGMGVFIFDFRFMIFDWLDCKSKFDNQK